MRFKRASRLRDLTKSGLVRQEAISTRTRAYLLTEKGRSLSGLLQHLYAWGLENSDSFGVRVGAPLEQLDARQQTNAADGPARRMNRAGSRYVARARGA